MHIIPELSEFVSGGDYVDTSGNNVIERYSLNYNAIFTYGLAATKELDEIVQNQQTENTLLKSKLNNIESENSLIKSKLNELLAIANKPTI